MTSKGRKDKRVCRTCAFTIVEILITVVILGILAAVAIPYYYGKIRQARTDACEANRRSIEKAAIMYSLDSSLLEGTPIPSASDMVRMRYLDVEPLCPAGGIYVWATSYYREGQVPRLGCSVHYIPPE